MMTSPPMFIPLSNVSSSVVVLQTTTGAQPASQASPYGGFNLGLHVGDEPSGVHAHRAQLLTKIQRQYPHISRICWLNQVHGGHVVTVDDALLTQPQSADAHITARTDTALAIMTADCVPIMVVADTGDKKSTWIGAIHAGWQGLACGVIANTVAQMREQMTAMKINQSAVHWQAWVGACIAPQHYEVDSRVKDAVLTSMNLNDDKDVSQSTLAGTLFRANPHKQGHYFADLASVAQRQLQRCGIFEVLQSNLDSYGDPRFYSYRWQTQQHLNATGRMATLIFKI